VALPVGKAHRENLEAVALAMAQHVEESMPPLKRTIAFLFILFPRASLPR